MAEKTGVIIGTSPIARYYRPNHDRIHLHVPVDAPDELYPHVAAELISMGCDEIILFACTFSNTCDKLQSKLIERCFRELPVPVYQTLYGTPIRLPVVSLQEFM